MTPYDPLGDGLMDDPPQGPLTREAAMTNQPYQPGIDPSHPQMPRRDERYQMAEQPPIPPGQWYSGNANVPTDRPSVTPFDPPKKKQLSTIAILLFVAVGGALISIGWAGIQWASLHEPSIGNALAGRQLYSDAEVIRILSIVGFLAGLGSIAYPIIRAVRR